ncbi:MAG: T9SS type A sorting domain-containing protein [Muribaculaceae bacterium]|nr:T9SS type A sorting domain-containing protein [Muribaculaceae bacterium]
MIKSTLLACMGLCGVLSVFGQSAESPLLLVAGENQYEVPDFEPWVSSVVYTYTNSTDEGQLVSLLGESISSVNAECGDSFIYAATSFTPGEQIFAVSPGATITLTVYPSVSTLEFDVTIKDGVNVDGGMTLTDAIPVSIGEFYVPWYFNSETFITSPTYLSLDVKEGGVYQFRHPGMSTLGFRKGNEGEFTILQADIDNSYISTYKLPANQPGEYMIEVIPMSAFIGELTLMTLGDEGTMPETAIEAQGTNNLPQESGLWWWKFTPEESGYALIESDAIIGEDGYSKIYDDISCSYALQSANGIIGLRQKVQAGRTYYTGINKGETSVEDSFTITVGPAQQGDTKDDPIVLPGEGEYTTPKYNGTYYYSIPVPDNMEGNYVFVQASSQFLSSETSATLTSSSDISQMVNGYARVKVDDNDNCMLQWNLDEGINNISFRVGYAEKEIGDDIDSSIEAKEGTNALAAGPEKYYVFHPSMREYLGIKVADPNVRFDICTRSGIWLMQLEKFEEDGWMKARISDLREDVLYIIFYDIAEPTEFELKEIPFQVGDVFEFPEEAHLGENPLPACDRHFYKFTAETTSWLLIERPEPSYMSFYYMVYPSNGMDPYYTNSFDGIAFDGGIKYEVKAGETYILEFTYVTEPGVITLSTEPMQPGEGRESAVETEGGVIELPAGVDYMWYKYEVASCGYLKISSDIEYESDYVGGTWKSSSLEAYLVGSEEVNNLYDYETDKYTGSLTVRPGETYLILVKNVSGLGGKTLTINMEDPEEMIVGSNVMPEISAWYGYRWYVADVPTEGDITLSSTDYSFDMELYLPDDFNNPVAISETIDNRTSELKYHVTEPSRLYFLITYAFAGTEIDYSFKSTSGVETIANDTSVYRVENGKLHIKANDASVEIYTLNGSLVKKVYVDNDIHVSLPKGCYVVKVNGQAFKVIM